MLPLYRLLIKDKNAKNQAENERLDRYIQREAQIIEVIKENSQVIAGLKTTMENLDISTVRSFERIHARLNAIGSNLEKVRLIVDHTPAAGNTGKIHKASGKKTMRTGM